MLILDTYYPAFLRAFFERRPDLLGLPYAAQWRALQDQCFGTADFYSLNLAALGHEAHEVVANSGELQLQWAREHAPRLARAYPPAAAGRRPRALWKLAAVGAQIEWYRPDVLYVQDLNTFPAALLRWARRWARLIVGQTAYPLPRRLDLRAYDLIVSSFPHYVRRFRAQGLASEYLRIAFEPRVLERLPRERPAHDAVFVGSYTSAHRQGVELLEQVAGLTPLEFWGYGAERLPPGSPIRRRYHGEAWGLAMYTLLAGARVALNRHINVAEQFANNMRLYEATGVGACLLTDRKANLGELFEIGQEVVTYDSPEECAEQVRYLLGHEGERARIAAAGQRRTLREHTYAQRMQELAPMLERHLRESSAAGRRSLTPGASMPEAPRPTGAAADAGAGLSAIGYRLSAIPGAGLSAIGYRLSAIPGSATIRRGLGRLRGRSASISYGHRQIAAGEIEALSRGWQSDSIPEQQRRLVAEQLQRMYAGKDIPVFRVAAEAIRATGVVDPLIVELGCASAYYSEALRHLLKQPFRYVGLDYSAALLRQARRHYAQLPLACADAVALPLADGCCEIVLSSGLLLHVPDYRRAIAESARLSMSWCIFHRTPVVSDAATTALAKYAYGVPVVEIVFNEGELTGLLAEAGLEVREALPIESYPLPELDARVEMKTFVCRRRAG